MDFFNSIFRFSIEELPYVIITLVIAFTIHEFAHAYVAYKFGDSTAKNQGRLTLNPVQHIDPIGALFLLIAGFGWARPVPVNRYHFKNPRLAGILVSLAGPISNLLLATIGVAFIYGSMAAGIADGLPFYVLDFLEFFISINVLLFVFNLIPLKNSSDSSNFCFNNSFNASNFIISSNTIKKPIIFINKLNFYSNIF